MRIGILSGMQAERMRWGPLTAWVHQGCRRPRANEGPW